VFVQRLFMKNHNEKLPAWACVWPVPQRQSRRDKLPLAQAPACPQFILVSLACVAHIACEHARLLRGMGVSACAILPVPDKPLATCVT
jgi:hypothetical protein